MKAEPIDKTQRTESNRYSERCLNPLCHNPVAPKLKHAPAKFYCSGLCKQRASIIKRAAKLLRSLSDADVLKIIRGQ